MISAIVARQRNFRSFEGRYASVVLEDGSRLGPCLVISAGHVGATSLWLDVDGIDVFVPLARVADVVAPVRAGFQAGTPPPPRPSVTGSGSGPGAPGRGPTTGEDVDASSPT